MKCRQPRRDLHRLNDLAALSLLLATLGVALSQYVVVLFTTMVSIIAFAFVGKTQRGFSAALIVIVFGLPLVSVSLLTGAAINWLTGMDQPATGLLAVGVSLGIVLALAWDCPRSAVPTLIAALIATGFVSSHLFGKMFAFIAGLGALHIGLVAQSWIAARAAVFRESRGRSGICPSCQYDCRGLPSTPNRRVKCPECGGSFLISSKPR